MAAMRFVIVKVHADSDYGRESLRWTDVPIFNVSLRKFHFTYFFLTGEPRLHKSFSFFWAPLSTHNSYIYSCTVKYILAK